MLDDREDVALPVPGPTEVLIAVAAAGVNNTDIWTREGAYGRADAVGKALARKPGGIRRLSGRRPTCSFCGWHKTQGVASGHADSTVNHRTPRQFHDTLYWANPTSPGREHTRDGGDRTVCGKGFVLHNKSPLDRLQRQRSSSPLWRRTRLPKDSLLALVLLSKKYPFFLIHRLRRNDRTRWLWLS